MHLDNRPRRVLNWQGWWEILILALGIGWSHAGDGLIGLVANIQSSTGPAGLGWVLQRAVLLGQKVESKTTSFLQISPACPTPLGFSLLLSRQGLGHTFSSSSSSLSELASGEIHNSRCKGKARTPAWACSSCPKQKARTILASQRLSRG